MLMEQLTEYRVGRNFIRLGDMVRVDTEGKGRPFIAKVQRLDKKTDGIEVSVIVKAKLNGAEHAQAGMSRVVMADRVSRVAQTKWERWA